MTDNEKRQYVTDAEKRLGERFGGEVKNGYKTAYESNPIVVQRYSADPYAMEYGGRIYVYSTHDIYNYNEDGTLNVNNYGKINTLNCYSSADLVNWCDHGVIEVARGEDKICKWAHNSWAPAACWKEIDGTPKFFLYFANSAGGIGVMTADSPTGPWTDPLGHEIITRQTPNCEGVLWMFDPAVLVDDDGEAYIYFGGGVPRGKEANPGTARVIKLGADMISTVGEAAVIDAPFVFEDSGINKIEGKYVYSYCHNFSGSDAEGNKNPGVGHIAVMESDSPMGPFVYRGTIMKNPGHYFGVYGNNHHCMREFKGSLYMFYHTQLLDKLIHGHAKDYRATHVNKVNVVNGVIEDIVMTKKGVDQVENLDAYSVIEAEMMAASSGVDTKKTDEKSEVFASNMLLTDVDDGDWVMLRGVDFGDGANALRIKYTGNGEGVIKVTLDGFYGAAVTYAEISADGGFKTVEVPVVDAAGVHDVYFRFIGSGYEIDSWQFVK